MENNDTLNCMSMVDSSINFWFSDNGHVRCPFPNGIKDSLAFMSKDKFELWVNKLSDKAKDEINDEILVEKFEEILFETALSMVENEDDRITIKYPFLPRLNDEMKRSEQPGENHKSLIIHRELVKKGDSNYLKIRLNNVVLDEKWETEFELPE